MINEMTTEEFQTEIHKRYKEELQSASNTLLSNDKDGYRLLKVLTKLKGKTGLVTSIKTESGDIIHDVKEIGRVIAESLPTINTEFDSDAVYQRNFPEGLEKNQSEVIKYLMRLPRNKAISIDGLQDTSFKFCKPCTEQRTAIYCSRCEGIIAKT